jgi:Cu/Ag efflux protein CusF
MNMMNRRAVMLSGVRISALAVLGGAPVSFGWAQTKEASNLFHGVGVVTELNAASAVITIDHEAIPGFMDAMEMPYRVRSASLIDGLHKGDKIDFTVEGKTYVIVAVKKAGSP